MTLQEAIAEVREVPFGDASWPALKAVLNAVASGDLIPQADAEQAVAVAYQRAADVCFWTDTGFHDGMSGDWHPVNAGDALAAAKAAILALAPADALAEVEKLKAELGAARRRGDTLAEGWRISDDARIAAEAEVARLRGCISMALGKMHPSESLLAWNTLTAALGNTP